jgi:hypothetical protein
MQGDSQSSGCSVHVQPASQFGLRFPSRSSENARACQKSRNKTKQTKKKTKKQKKKKKNEKLYPAYIACADLRLYRQQSRFKDSSQLLVDCGGKLFLINLNVFCTGSIHTLNLSLEGKRGRERERSREERVER